MKSQISSGKPKKPSRLIVRRVVGDSMLPTLKSGQIVVGLNGRRPKIGQLVIVRYKNREIVKRLTKIKDTKLYIIGDNTGSSTDSNSFGWLAKKQLLATVIWPKK